MFGSPPRRRRRGSNTPRLPFTITASFAEIAEWGESSLDVENVEAETRERELQEKFMALVRDGLDLEWIASILGNFLRTRRPERPCYEKARLALDQ